jgi:hypothetical protein
MPTLLQWRSFAPVEALKLRLVAGDRQFGLYGLRSFVILPHRVQVLLDLHAELRFILVAWHVTQASNRWIALARSASLIRQMENCPVRAGLAQRPEQWRWSSAWED